MSRENILFSNIHKLSNFLVKPKPGVINLVGPVNESLNEIYLVRVRGEVEIIS